MTAPRFVGQRARRIEDPALLRGAGRYVGDIELPGLLHAVVLKVPHHGGDTSLAAFIKAIGARLAVVSMGPNRYGHPVPRVLAELAHGRLRSKLPHLREALRGRFCEHHAFLVRLSLGHLEHLEAAITEI